MGSSRIVVLAVLAGLLSLPAQSAAEPRIINGGLPSQAWPAQVSLHHGFLISPSGFCAGTLVSARWILTAGHCVTNNTGNERPSGDWNFTTESAKSRVGATARTSGGTAITVDQVVRHENYNDTTLDHDLALLHLASPVPEEPLRLIGSDDSSALGARRGGDGHRLGRDPERRPEQQPAARGEGADAERRDVCGAGADRLGLGVSGDVDGVRRGRYLRHLPRRLRRAAHDAARRPVRARRRHLLRHRAVWDGELPERSEPVASRRLHADRRRLDQRVGAGPGPDRLLHDLPRHAPRRSADDADRHDLCRTARRRSSGTRTATARWMPPARA